ncbi:MAG: hypothetical protein ABI140_20930 [Jatrophihabitantaceae bacterium]
MTGIDLHDQAADDDDVVTHIEAVIAALTGPDGIAELPLPDAASQLEDLHQLLQGALTSLDRA